MLSQLNNILDVGVEEGDQSDCAKPSFSDFEILLMIMPCLILAEYAVYS